MRPLRLRLFDYFLCLVNVALGIVILIMIIVLIRSVREGNPSSVALNGSLFGFLVLIFCLILKFTFKYSVENYKQALGVVLALSLMLFGAEEASIRVSIMVQDFYVHDFSELGLEYVAMISIVISLWLSVSLIGYYLLYKVQNRITNRVTRTH